jgi:hypothetical protein
MNTWDYDLFNGQVDLEEHTGLLLAEDAALKEYLLGIAVPDKNGTTPVDVWFRYPEGERRIKFPFITIDFLAINPSYDRWTSFHHVDENYSIFEDPITGEEVRRGMYIPSTSPTLPDKDSETTGYHIEPYLMYTLMYQVCVHTRSAMHDRYLASRFMTDIFPPRPFWIGVEADHTWRRCELQEMTPADIMETTESGNKRIFRKIYTISMDAEIPQSRAYAIEKAYRLHIDLYPTPVEAREPALHAYDDVHAYADYLTVEPPSGS